MFADVPTEYWIVLGCVVALVTAWVGSVIAFVVTHWIANQRLKVLMGEFAERFPHRCFLCSYYYDVLSSVPPEHDCNEWTAEP